MKDKEMRAKTIFWSKKLPLKAIATKISVTVATLFYLNIFVYQCNQENFDHDTKQSQ